MNININILSDSSTQCGVSTERGVGDTVFPGFVRPGTHYILQQQGLWRRKRAIYHIHSH